MQYKHMSLLSCDEFDQSWNSCVVIRAPAITLEKLRRLSEPAALEMLLWYFDATHDSGVGAGSSRTHFLTSMHCFKSVADQFSLRCMKSNTPIATEIQSFQ